MTHSYRVHYFHLIRSTKGENLSLSLKLNPVFTIILVESHEVIKARYWRLEGCQIMSIF